MIKIFLFITLIIFSPLFAADEVLLPSGDVISINFIVNGKSASVPDSVLEKIKNLNKTNYDEELIDSLVKNYGYHNVKFTKKNNSITIYADKQPIIQDVQFLNLGPLSFFDFYRVIKSQINTEYDPAKAKADRSAIEDYAHKRGYPNALVTDSSVTETEDKNFVKITFSLERNDACRIAEIIYTNLNRALIDIFDLHIETGDLCDVIAIKTALDQKKLQFQKQGFLQATSSMQSIEYSSDKKSARITLDIKTGPRTVFRVKDDEANNDSNIITTLFDLDSKIAYSDIAWMTEDDLILYITKVYQDKGYPEAIVSFVGKKEYSEKNLIEYVFSIKRGRYFSINQMTFKGPIIFSNEELLNTLNFSDGSVPFVQSNLEMYQQLLRNFYYNKGYPNVAISYPSISSDNETDIQVEFSIFPKKQFFIRSLRIVGLPFEVQNHEKKILDMIKGNNLMDKKNITNILEEMRSTLLSYGFYFSKIEPSYHYEEDKDVCFVDIFLTISGSKQVRINRIFVEGDTYEKEDRIIAISGLVPGSIFTPEAIEEAKRQLLRHLFLADVVIEPLGSSSLVPTSTSIDLVIRARVKRGFSLGLSPGFGTFYGYRFMANYRLNDLNRQGLNFLSRLSIQQNQEQQQWIEGSSIDKVLGYDILFQLNQPLLRVGSWVSPFDGELSADYSSKFESLSARFYQRYRLGLINISKFLGFDTKMVFDVNNESSGTIYSYDALNMLEPDNIVLKELALGFEFSKLDNPAWPQLGLKTSLYGSQAFQIGDANFTLKKVTFDTELYFPIYGPFSSMIKFGMVKVLDSQSKSGVKTTIPPTSRRASYLGSDPVVRGFFPTGGGSIEPLLWTHWKGPRNCQTYLADLSSTGLIYLKYENRLKVTKSFGISHFIDSGISYYTSEETKKINATIKNFNSSSSSITAKSNTCIPDQYQFDDYVSSRFNEKNLFHDYFKYAYVSTGIGLSYIIGNFVSIYMNYGYPLRDPAAQDKDCENVTAAINAGPSNPPKCIVRIQKNYFFFNWFAIYGAVNFGVTGQF